MQSSQNHLELQPEQTPGMKCPAPPLSVEDLVCSIAKALVRDKDIVHLVSRQDAHGTILTLKVAPEDLPSLLGGHVRTLDSMRTLVQSVGKRQQRRIALHVVAATGTEPLR